MVLRAVIGNNRAGTPNYLSRAAFGVPGPTGMARVLNCALGVCCVPLLGGLAACPTRCLGSLVSPSRVGRHHERRPAHVHSPPCGGASSHHLTHLVTKGRCSVSCVLPLRASVWVDIRLDDVIATATSVFKHILPKSVDELTGRLCLSPTGDSAAMAIAPCVIRGCLYGVERGPPMRQQPD
jgi:hypothetical protein